MTSASICPQEIRIANHKIQNRKREKDPVLVAIKKRWCIGKVCSCGCGRPANTPHHPSGALYENDVAYIDPDNWEPYYHTCHHNMHRGLIRCPGCGGWMRPGYEKCSICRGTVQLRVNRKGKRYHTTYRLRHPCRFRLSYQGCELHRICTHSWKRARECGGFEERQPCKN